MGEDPQYFFTDQGKTDRLKKINQQKLFFAKNWYLSVHTDLCRY